MATLPPDNSPRAMGRPPRSIRGAGFRKHHNEQEEEKQCENYMHIWATMGTRMSCKEQDEFLRGVMDLHGEEYNTARAAMEKQTA